MSKIPQKVRNNIHERDQAIDTDGYKDPDYIHCCSCGKWHRISDRSKEIHHIDSNRLNNEEWNLVTLCEKCHRVLHNVSIKKQQKIDISLSIYHYMLKLYPDKEDHYRRYLKIDQIPDNQIEEFTLENTGGGNQDVYSF